MLKNSHTTSADVGVVVVTPQEHMGFLFILTSISTEKPLELNITMFVGLFMAVLKNCVCVYMSACLFMYCFLTYECLTL